MDFFHFLHFFGIFQKKYPIFLKSMKKIAPLTQATWSQKSSFSQFSLRQKLFFLRGKIAKNQLHLAKFGCVSGAISIFRKPGC